MCYITFSFLSLHYEVICIQNLQKYTVWNDNSLHEPTERFRRFIPFYDEGYSKLGLRSKYVYKQTMAIRVWNEMSL